MQIDARGRQAQRQKDSVDKSALSPKYGIEDMSNCSMGKRTQFPVVLEWVNLSLVSHPIENACVKILIAEDLHLFTPIWARALLLFR
jgi:hypothetical protein